VDNAVVGFWERAAESYETEVPYFTPMGERIVARAGLHPGEVVLDVACGKGSTLVPAAHAVGPSGRVVGIDIVPAMVEAARLAARDAGVANVEVEVMDAEELQMPDRTFNVVICAFALGFIRPEVSLTEMARVLRRPGRLITSAPAGGGPNWEFFGELCDRYGLKSVANPRGAKTPTREEAVEMFARAGFILEAREMDSVTVVFSDVDSWWRWAWSHGQRGFLEGLDDGQAVAFKAEAASAIESFATSEGIILEQRFIVLTARVAT
jgi:SAM-dependent methyltransferase